MPPDERPLAGRTVLVTGASRGIGAAVARRLGGAGARVALLARSANLLQQLATSLGANAGAFPCDVSDESSLARAIASVTEWGGAPDAVVNNAGAFTLQPAVETSVAELRRIVELNLVGPFAVVRALLPAMLERGSGHLVTIGSIADRTTFPGNAAYASSKFGVRALHEVLRAELRGTGVRTSLVSPGPVDTSLWDPVNPDTRPGFTPRSAMLSAEAVADAVHYVLAAPPELNVDELRLSRS